MERATLEMTKVKHLEVATLRRIWKAACRELRVTTRRAMFSMTDAVGAPPHWLVEELLFEVVRARAVLRKTGRRVMRRATTSGGCDRMVDETVWDEEPARAAIARILATAKVAS